MDPNAADIIDGLKTYKLFIDGQWVTSKRNVVVDDINPASGQVFARVQKAGTEEVETAIAAAFRASVSWGASLAADREMLLLRVGDIVSRRKNEIRDLLIEECGSAFTFACGSRPASP